jgi:hypothetical protein
MMLAFVLIYLRRAKPFCSPFEWLAHADHAKIPGKVVYEVDNVSVASRFRS